MAAAVLLLGLMVTTRSGVGRAALAQSALGEALAPFEFVTGSAVRGVVSIESGVRGLFNAESANTELRAQVKMLKARLAGYDALRQDDIRLRGLLALRTWIDQQYPYAGGLAVEVIARSPNTWFSSVVVDKGSDEGVRRGMIGVAPAGLVGRVTAVTPHSATLTLITNPDAGVGGLVERASSRAAGVVSGQLGRTFLSMEFFVPRPSVQVGDQIVTSGLGGLYPEGLLIGRVTAVGRGGAGLVGAATVQPAVDLAQLQYLLLIASPAGALP